MESGKGIIKVGNLVGGGTHQAGSVYLIDGVSPTLVSGMDHCNTMPYIVEIEHIGRAEKCKKED